MGAVLYAQAVLADSPRGFYKLDEFSGLPQDSSGNGNHMTSNPGPGGTDQEYRLAGPWAGSYGIRQRGGRYFSRNVISTQTDNFSIEVWWAFEAAGGDDVVVCNGSRSADGWGIDYNSATGNIRAIYGNVAFEGNSSAFADVSEWNQIVLTRDSGTTKYYFNGALDTANAGTDTPLTPVTRWQIGSNVQVQGIWSNVSLYNTALSLARVSAHYNAAFSVEAAAAEPERSRMGWPMMVRG